VLARHIVRTGAGATEPEGVARIVVESMEQVSRATGRGQPPLGIGVSVPGSVDRLTGRVAVAPNLDWHDVAFGALLAELLPSGMQVSVGNDADLAVLAEHRRGGVRDVDDVVFLLGRIGVGAGIIANGRPLRGIDGYAGEIGHNVVDVTGPACHCGKSGCVETYIGEGALLRLAGRPEAPSDEVTAAVFAEARRRDAGALAAVRGVAESLGRALASLVNTLNPQRVMLGGYLAELLDIARPEIELALKEYALEAPGRHVQLVPPSFGADSALLGAAELAFADLLADPLARTSALPA
jgi:predicted NBD/HSP70 family sugar kinase